MSKMPAKKKSYFSRQRRQWRRCCSSQHPWRGHFSPILAEGRELQPPLQQFEFVSPGSANQAHRGGAEEATTGLSHSRSASALRPSRPPPPPPLTRSGAARGGRDRRRRRPPAGAAPPLRGGPRRLSPPPERVSVRDCRHVSGAELRLEPRGRASRPRLGSVARPRTFSQPQPHGS